MRMMQQAQRMTQYAKRNTFRFIQNKDNLPSRNTKDLPNHIYLDKYNKIMIEIERLGFIEGKMGVKLESIFAGEGRKGWTNLSYGRFTNFQINGELHTIDGSQLSQDVRLVMSAHDSSNRVLGSGSIEIKAREFFGFDIFFYGIAVYACEDLVTKVRIYPTPSR